jgi:hypothetical protein
MDEIEICIAIRNTSKQPLTVYLEPWGEEHQLQIDGQLIVVGVGPKEGSGFVVEHSESSVSLSAWDGSTIQVFVGGNEISAFRPRVPKF